MELYLILRVWNGVGKHYWKQTGTGYIPHDRFFEAKASSDNNAWYGMRGFWGLGSHYDYALNVTLGMRP